MKIKGAIFDMDGTLLDSMPTWYRLGDLYLFSKMEKPEKNLAERFKTMPVTEAAVYMKEKYDLKETPQQIIDEISKVLRDCYMTKIKEKKDVRKVLDDLKDHGIPMCVASATDAELVECALEHAGLLSYFSEIFCCRDVGEGKSSDKIYQMARESMGCTVEETLVFEDALHAAKTVKQAGFPLAVIFDSMEKDQDEIKKISNIYLDTFSQWPGIDQI